MTIIQTPQDDTATLPPGLQTAHEAIRRPEVQDMIRRLAEYNLGVFMPHMHDQQTGEFRTLPDELTQVEAGLETSFHPAAELGRDTERFLAVGWVWRAGAVTASAVCEMATAGGGYGADRTVKHKMPSGD